MAAPENLQAFDVMNGSLPLHASVAYSGAAGEDPFDFDLFTTLARESPPSLASADQAPPPPPPYRDINIRPASFFLSAAFRLRTSLPGGFKRTHVRRAQYSAWLPAQDSSPTASGRPASSGQQDSWGVPCTAFHSYAAQLDGLANDLWEVTPPVAQPGMRRLNGCHLTLPFCRHQCCHLCQRGEANSHAAIRVA